MNMTEKKVRITDELYDQLQKIAEKNNKSIKDIVEEAIKAYLLGIEGVEKPLKQVQSKVIPTQFDSRCFTVREM
jgi:Ribbon-helix-helix protein, copG family.